MPSIDRCQYAEILRPSGAEPNENRLSHGFRSASPVATVPGPSGAAMSAIGPKLPRFRSVPLTLEAGATTDVKSTGRSSPLPPLALIVLRHKFRRRGFMAVGLAQHGQRDKVATRPALRRRRIVAIELGTCRSGRSGGASGSVTLGKGKFLDDMPGSRSAGGKIASFGDEESISGDTHRGVMMKPPPASWRSHAAHGRPSK